MYDPDDQWCCHILMILAAFLMVTICLETVMFCKTEKFYFFSNFSIFKNSKITAYQN